MKTMRLWLLVVLGLISGVHPGSAQLGGGAAGTAFRGMWDQIRGTIPPEVLKKQSSSNAEKDGPRQPQLKPAYRPIEPVAVKISVPAFSVVAPPAWFGYVASLQDDNVELVRAQSIPGDNTQCSDCSMNLRFFPYVPFVPAPSPGHPVPDDQLHMFADVGIQVWAERIGLHGNSRTTALPITIGVGSGIVIKVGSYPSEDKTQKAFEHTNVFLVLRRPAGMLWIAIHAPSSHFAQIGEECDKVIDSVVFNNERSSHANAASTMPLPR